ncbi:MAG: NTP transferase domain-containing protein [Clostridia bacterium]|nr:NTP transferase domain-containing protein [Clostridia bacterium]
MGKDITLVVMAAGMGSRFGGLKQMEPIGPNGEALLDFSAYDAKEAGFTKVVFVIKHAIEKEFKEIVGARIEKIIKTEYVFQEIDDLPNGLVPPADRTKPWGTAQAILACRNVVKEPFAVVNADDFYGRSAFQKIAEFLKSDSEDYGMVGFKLINTLTENGHVSRGVCDVENDELKGIVERTKIIDCKFTEDDGASWTPLSPDTIVSMNLWGFRPDIFAYLQKDFEEFLSEKINVPKSECLLPATVAKVIESGEKTVRVMVADERWYGVTYKEDKPTVVNAIAKMIEEGKYNNL